LDYIIERVAQDYQTPIGEHDVGFSRGQKQHIAVARALLKKSKILIFDETTSDFDRHTTEQFAQTANQLKGSAMILFIAHAMLFLMIAFSDSSQLEMFR